MAPSARTKKIGKHTYRLVQEDEHQVVEVQSTTKGAWQRLTRNEVLAHAAESPLWTWLYGLGVTRPSPSGVTGGAVPSHQARQAGGDKRVEAYFSPEAQEALERGIAAHGSKRAALEKAVIAAYPKKK